MELERTQRTLLAQLGLGLIWLQQYGFNTDHHSHVCLRLARPTQDRHVDELATFALGRPSSCDSVGLVAFGRTVTNQNLPAWVQKPAETQTIKRC